MRGERNLALTDPQVADRVAVRSTLPALGSWLAPVRGTGMRRRAGMITVYFQYVKFSHSSIQFMTFPACAGLVREPLTSYRNCPPGRTVVVQNPCSMVPGGVLMTPHQPAPPQFAAVPTA